MPENEKRQPTAEVHQSVTVTVQHTRTHRHTKAGRNYPLLQRGKEIIQRNYNGIKTYINRNYRRFSY